MCFNLPAVERYPSASSVESRSHDVKNDALYFSGIKHIVGH